MARILKKADILLKNICLLHILSRAGSLSFLLSILFILFFLILKPIIQFRETPDQDLLLIIIKFIHDGCDHLFVESCMMNKRLLALICCLLYTSDAADE